MCSLRELVAALAVAAACTPAATAQVLVNDVPLGDTISLRDSVLSPTTPITLARAGQRWESRPIAGLVYRFDAAEGPSFVAEGAWYHLGWALGSSPGKRPIVYFAPLPASGPAMRAYGVRWDRVPPDPLPWVFIEIE